MIITKVIIFMDKFLNGRYDQKTRKLPKVMKLVTDNII